MGAESSIQTVNARELHGFLGNGQEFTNWIAGRIKKYGFAEGVDFATTDYLTNQSNIPRGRGRPTKEYHVSIDMAKELAMVERNDQGRKARQYFIECEKKLKQVAPTELPSYSAALAPATAAPVQTHGPVIVTRVAPLPTLNIVETDGVQTMSSLDMVAYINATRGSDKAELRHDSFMAKVPNVLGYSASPKFIGYVPKAIGNGATRNVQVYNFPRREAMLMAMSYSYKLQATVYDAWQAAEARTAEGLRRSQFFE